MKKEELNNLIDKYYSDKNFKIDGIEQLGFFERLRYSRLFQSAYIYNNLYTMLIKNKEFREEVFCRKIHLIEKNGYELTKYIDINVLDNDIEIEEFDSYNI